MGVGVVMFRVGSTLLTRPKTRFFLTRPDPSKNSWVTRVAPDIFFDFTPILGYHFGIISQVLSLLSGPIFLLYNATLQNILPTVLHHHFTLGIC